MWANAKTLYYQKVDPLLQCNFGSFSSKGSLSWNIWMPCSKVFIGPRYTWGPIYGSGSILPCWDLADVTLADQDINSILADNANRAIQGNMAIQVVPFGGQNCNICKWHRLMPKFGTNASCTTLGKRSAHLIISCNVAMQVAPLGGQICD